ncbi:TetR/AcrR family transcriptional regulator [Kordiimonas sp. SCSIO 12610]|uniref:TetR/AcrR family transcriptional regulator n=1 Tax=Kordiimonas sp. SCSIO 12610 TaxID=2829597 RepID=UPI00210EB670|nr:TetR/AcrR family transcriptional regulator [Kordiimonas sp. SCSIO 12610]UTW55212.1 TetR/AcrR family transcriptional regulator [Kordiimonas sp. SCSIO 12610]
MSILTIYYCEMARPSIKQERTEEILDAFEICVAKYGVEGSTLEKIAEQAGLRRSLLRHYIGNREALLSSLVKRFINKSHQQSDYMKSLTISQPAHVLIDFLYNRSAEQNMFALTAQSLIIAANERDDLKNTLKIWMEDFVETLEDILRTIHKNNTDENYKSIAVGIAGIYSNYASLAPLGGLSGLEGPSRKASEYLINSLDESQ